MSNKEKIYNDALSFRMVEHDFGQYKAIFYKGFKFEKEILDNGFSFRIYSTRSSIYKEISQSDVNMLLEKGIFESSAFFSYFSYDRLMNRYKNTSENKASSYKTVEKSIKVMNEYRDRCSEILLRYPKLLEN